MQNTAIKINAAVKQQLKTILFPTMKNSQSNSIIENFILSLNDQIRARASLSRCYLTCITN